MVFFANCSSFGWMARLPTCIIRKDSCYTGIFLLMEKNLPLVPPKKYTRGGNNITPAMLVSCFKASNVLGKPPNVSNTSFDRILSL